MKDEIMIKKRILIIVIIVLLVLLSICYFYNLENKHQLTNNSCNNITNIQLNKTINKNISLNNSTNDNETHNNYDKVKFINKNNKISNKTYNEAFLSKKIAEKYVIDGNEIVGFPVYKNKRMDAWLVPIFDKNTKKFKGSVYVHCVKGGGIFVSGPDSYSVYKELVSGKKIKHNSKSLIDKTKVNKSNKKTIKNKTNTNKSTKNNIKSSLINSSTLNLN